MSPEQVAGSLEADAEALAALSEAHSIKGAAAKIVVIDGVVSDQLSGTEGLPHQAFVGSLREAPVDLMADHLVGLPSIPHGNILPRKFQRQGSKQCQTHSGWPAIAALSSTRRIMQPFE